MTAKMSPEVSQEFKQAFKMLDVDGDGKITAIELQAIMKQFQFNSSEDDIQHIIKKIDLDNSGTIELDQFLSFIESQVDDQKDEAADLRKMFQLFDKDGNGFITKQELGQGLDQLGEHLSEQDLNQILEQADMDGDGNISFEQFMELMKGK